MDLRPIEARADEFFTWIGRFDSGQRVDAAFASAADVPALIDEVKRLREKIDVDRAMHEAFRPEVVAEVAVLVSDEMDWQAVADWCGGTIGSAQEPSGEYTSSITIPGVGDAYQGMWIVQRHDLTFAIRATLEGPSAESVARLTARPAPAWDEEAIRAARDEYVRHNLGMAVGTYGDRLRCAFEAGVDAVREHLPTKPDREALAQKAFEAAGRDDWGAANDLERDEWLDVADAWARTHPKEETPC